MVIVKRQEISMAHLRPASEYCVLQVVVILAMSVVGGR